MSDSIPKYVTVRYASNAWSVDPLSTAVTEAGTYIEFTLETAGYRFADPIHHPAEPSAVVVNNPQNSFIGPWTRNDTSASLLDLKTGTPGTFTYSVNLVQTSTGESLTVPVGTLPTIVNS